jgi:dTDP-4-amino-4,6-dideoxygalactose transaminase
MGEIDKIRIKIYNNYHSGFLNFDSVELPVIPDNCKSSCHMFYILLKSENYRDNLIKYLKGQSINCVFHYVPLHTSPMGERFGYKEGDLPITESVASRLVRLPFYNNLSKESQELIISKIKENFFDSENLSKQELKENTLAYTLAE